MTNPVGPGRAVKPRPTDGPEFAQTASRGQDLVGKQAQAQGHGQGEMPKAGGSSSQPHGSLRSKLAGDTQESSIEGSWTVCTQGSAENAPPFQESLWEEPVQVIKTSFSCLMGG